jgi:hypothetical protein
MPRHVIANTLGGNLAQQELSHPEEVLSHGVWIRQLSGLYFDDFISFVP